MHKECSQILQRRVMNLLVITPSTKSPSTNGPTILDSPKEGQSDGLHF